MATIKGGWSYADVPVTVKNSEALDEVERNLVLRLFHPKISPWLFRNGSI